MVDLIFLNSLQSLSDLFHSRQQQVLVYQVIWFMIDWCDVPKLTEFTAGDYTFRNTDSLSFKGTIWLMIDDWFDLPKLNTLTIGGWSFRDTKDMIISSDLIDYWLIWSSWTHYIHCRRYHPMGYTEFESYMFDNCWLIDWIFLNSHLSL